METVQLQCGHCQQLIAISVEHLGGQVQCPHCKGVLQTSPRVPQPETAAPAALPNMDLNQRESIFAGEEASDAVLGETAVPKVELPASAASAPFADAPLAAAAGPASGGDADLTQFKPRPVFDRGVFTLYALIFLVPYAILSTVAIIYLVVQGNTRPHPFDMLPDPVPAGAKGGAKKAGLKIDPLHSLAAHQKVGLGKSIQIGKDGDLVVTPEKIRLTEDGDLQLFLRAKNISANTAFSPMHDSFVRYAPGPPGAEPYTFLESKSQKVENIYGAFLEYRVNLQKDAAGRDSLGPNDETIVVLTTTDNYRKPHIAKIAESNDSYTWRVQLRRGFVKYRGKDTSATAVIGVEFTSAQIERDKKS